MIGELNECMRRAREDPGFRAKLLAGPAAALAEQGVRIKPDIELRVVEHSAGVRYFVMPPDDLNRWLPDRELHAVVGGTSLPGGFETDLPWWLLVTVLGGH